MSKLRFGYNAGLPEGVRAAWGCRAIWNGSGLPDIVWDRTDAFGDDEARRPLLDYLREIVGDAPWEAARTMSGLWPDRDYDAVLFEDDEVIVRANTQASGGYLYVCAYRKIDVPEGAST